MSPEEAFYFAAIVLVGLPAAFRLSFVWDSRGLLVTVLRLAGSIRVRNPVALAMVATWFACRLLWSITGECPPQALVISDMVVIASTFVKDDWAESAYRGKRHMIACLLWFERTPWDRVILALFPVAWLLYGPVLTRFEYWTLYGIGLAQLAIAGWEGVHNWQRTKANSSHADAPGDFSGMMFAPVQGRLDA